MDWITAPLVCAIIFGSIYKVVELFVHTGLTPCDMHMINGVVYIILSASM